MSMDPRRRDPRLARASDPRLQVNANASSSTTRPPYPVPSNVTYSGGGNTPMDATPTPPQPFVQAMQDVQQQVAPEAEVVSSAMDQVPYKQRPLFCVVCASNQVRSSVRDHGLSLDLSGFVESVHGRPFCPRVSAPQCSPLASY